MNLSVTAQAPLQKLSTASQPAQTIRKPEAPSQLGKHVLGADASEIKAAAAGALVGATAVYLPIVGFANAMQPLIGGSFAESLLVPFQDRSLVSAMGVGAGLGAFAGMAAAGSSKSVGEGALRGGAAGVAMGAFAGGVIGAFIEGRPSMGGAMYGAIRGALAGGLVGSASGAAATAVAR